MKKGSLDNILQLTKASMFAIVFERKFNAIVSHLLQWSTSTYVS